MEIINSKTWQGAEGLEEGQQVIMPIDQPIKATGHLQVRTANEMLWESFSDVKQKLLIKA